VAQRIDQDNGATERLDTAAVKGAMWLATDQVGSRVVDMVFTIALARLLLPGDFGLLALAATSTAFLRLFANLGLAAAIVQQREVDEELLSTAFWANVISGVVLFLIAAVAGKYMGDLLREPRVGVLILFLSSRFIIAAGAATQVALFSRRMDFRTLSLRSIIATLVAGVVAVVLAARGMGVWALVAQEIARTLTSTVLLYRATGWRPRRVFSPERFRVLWGFSGPLLGSRLLGYLVRNSDNLLVGRFLGSTALGFYSMAYSVFTAPLNDFAAIVHRVMFSTLSRLHGDGDRFKRGFLLATRYVTMLTIPSMVGLAAVAPLVVRVLFGERWLPAAPVISIFAMAAPFGLIMGIGPSGLQAGGRTDLQMWLSLISVLVYVPAFAIGLRWGIVGVAAGALVAAAVLAPIEFRVNARVTGVTFPELWDAVRVSLVGALLMGGVIVLARRLVDPMALPPVVALSALVALGVAVYGGIIWAAQRQTIVELLRVVKRVIPGRGLQPERLAREAK
jgi:O-antigen/teichoic acid export membrane protein